MAKKVLSGALNICKPISNNKTMSLSFKDDEVVKRNWFILDASNLTLGRLATFISNHICAKVSPMQTKHIDCGSKIVVINCDKIAFSGKKMTQKVYYRHTGYPGGLKEATLKEMLVKGKSTDVLEKAVKGMLRGGTSLKQKMLKNLRLYRLDSSNHDAQNLTPLKVIV